MAPLPEVFARLREAGADCVEVNLRPGNHDGLVLTPEQGPRVRQWAADAGLEIVSVSGINDFAVQGDEAIQTEIDRLVTACRIAAALEAGIVRAFVGDAKPGLTFDDVRPAVVAAFHRVLRETESLGVTLAIENHGRLLNDGPILADLVREIDSPHVRLTIDSGNFAWAGHGPEQVERDFAAMVPQTVNLHVKDGVWENGGFTFVPAGDGNLPLADLIAQLIARGYEGPLHSEYEGAGDVMAGTARSIAYLRATVEAAVRGAG
jgi:sugar phosphate isomerase/epimerase